MFGEEGELRASIDSCDRLRAGSRPLSESTIDAAQSHSLQISVSTTTSTLYTALGQVTPGAILTKSQLEEDNEEQVVVYVRGAVRARDLNPVRSSLSRADD
jgi:hypothetical protein